MRLGGLCIAAVLAARVAAAAPQEEWSSIIQKARLDLSHGEYTQALENLRKAFAGVKEQPGQETAKLECLRLLSAAARAAGNPGEALALLESAIKLDEESQAPRDDFAKDLTRLASFKIQAGDRKAGKETLLRVMDLWRESGPADGTQELAALDALAGLHRDDAEYPEAEDLLLRAMRIREVAYGPNSSELISTVDSLAYVLFGQKKFAEAEPYYKRLLALWEASAGPEHPMVALTLDKTAEFYAFQQRYAEAGPLVQRSLTLRTNLLMSSFNQTGRITLMQAKLEEARDLYTRAIRIGDDCKVDDEVMDPLLRIQSRLLRQIGQEEAANALDERVKAALLRKADREGRRTPPGK